MVAELPEPARRGATLFHDKGCLACHTIAGASGQRGPDLTTVGDRRSADQLTWRILSGGNNTPAYGTALRPNKVNALVEFLQTRRR